MKPLTNDTGMGEQKLQPSVVHIEENSAHSLTGDVLMTATGLFLATYIIIANILAITTLFRTQKLQTLSNLIIASLATADLLIGFVLIFYSLSFIDNFRSSVLDGNMRLCQLLIGGCLGWTVGSSLHILLIAFERYIYIVWPFLYQRLVTRLSVGCSLITVWISSVVFFILPTVAGRLDAQICDIKIVPASYIVYSICPICGVYATLNVFLYSRILKTARDQRRALDLPRGSFVDDNTTSSKCSDFVIQQDYHEQEQEAKDSELGHHPNGASDMSSQERSKICKKLFVHKSNKTFEKSCYKGINDYKTGNKSFPGEVYGVHRSSYMDYLLKNLSSDSDEHLKNPCIMSIHTVKDKKGLSDFKTDAFGREAKTIFYRQKTNTHAPQQYSSLGHYLAKTCTFSKSKYRNSNLITSVSLLRTKKYGLTNTDKANFYFDLTKCGENSFIFHLASEPYMSRPTCSAEAAETAPFMTEISTTRSSMTSDSTFSQSATTTDEEINRAQKPRNHKRLIFVMSLFLIHLVCKTPVVITMAVNLLTNTSHNTFVSRSLSLLALSNSGVNFVVFLFLQDSFRKAVKRQITSLINSIKTPCFYSPLK